MEGDGNSGSGLASSPETTLTPQDLMGSYGHSSPTIGHDHDPQGHENDTLDSSELDYNFPVNDSPTNGTGNETDYIYDYEAALETFFWSQLAPPLVVYAVTYVVGVLGNALIIFTICRYRRLKTTTNVFLASLASADLLLILICIPVKIARLFSYTWTMGYTSCKLIYYMQTVSTVCSVLTLTIISLERCYAIIYPMKAIYVCSISKAKKAALIIWVSSLFLASPNLMVQKHMEVGLRRQAYWCVRDFDSPLLWSYETYMLVLVLVMPACVMAAAYAAICIAIINMVGERRSITGKGQIVAAEASVNGKGDEPQAPAGLPGQDHSSCWCMGDVILEDLIVREVILEDLIVREVILEDLIIREVILEDLIVREVVVPMLIVVVALFIVCWGPLLILNVLQALNFIPDVDVRTKNAKIVLDLLSYFNSCMNPVVYGFMSKNFRKGFKRALCSFTSKDNTHPSLSQSHTLKPVSNRTVSRNGTTRTTTTTADKRARTEYGRRGHTSPEDISKLDGESCHM
ncbi:QRFP-like peptide receptor [Panulirus ornatus]|uniref:QRFP-like peptide receptor n=1 Tax=Panulirus ornatus TaxID=150431 RepID=UPI003A84A541